MRASRFSGTGPLGRACRLVAVAAVLSLASSPAAAGWEGTVIDRDGIPHVMNPGRPVEKPTTRELEELWRIGGDDEDEFFFGVLTQITSDEAGNVYLLDMQLNEVMIFSADGEYIRSIGRAGEGPGEFRRPSDLFLTADGHVAVMQRMPGKIVVMTPEGDPVGEHPVPEPEGGGMQMLVEGRLAGDRLVLVMQSFARHERGFDVKSALVAIDRHGARQATFAERETSNDFANMVIDEKTLGRNALVWSTDSRGRVYTSDDFDAYRIQVWMPDGTVERVIEREYEHRVRSKEDMERSAPRLMIRRNNRTMQPEAKMSKTDRDIRDIFPRDDGTLWVLSSRGSFEAPDGAIAAFDVFDRDGRFTRQVTLVGEGDVREDGFHIVKDRLYVVTGLRSARDAMFGGQESGEADERDAQPMAVICYDLSPIVHSMK